MKEKPVLFSTPMVKAVLEGRKTQTRRAVNIPQFLRWWYGNGWRVNEGKEIKEIPATYIANYSKYKPGDILWVRETWAADREGRYIYLADPMFDGCSKGDFAWNWKPSIHMPRVAARLFLEVKNVRCERLRNIRLADCNAEGYPDFSGTLDFESKRWYRDLWDSLYAKRGCSWESNPWVWVYEFERREGGKQ